MGSGSGGGEGKKSSYGRVKGEAQLARELGVSLRRLNGWEPRETTEYFYEDGVLVRSITSREPEWTTDEVSALLASRILEADVGPHGHPMSEATSPLADPANPKAKWKYVFREKAVIDRAAKVLGEGTDAFKERYFKDKPIPPGYHFSVDRVDLD